MAPYHANENGNIEENARFSLSFDRKKKVRDEKKKIAISMEQTLDVICQSKWQFNMPTVLTVNNVPTHGKRANLARNIRTKTENKLFFFFCYLTHQIE